MVTVEKRRVARTGTASLGWRLGIGYAQQDMTVKNDKWCIIKDGRILAECRSKAAADEIASAFEWVGSGA